MVALNKFDSFVEALSEKVHNLGSDSLKVALTNTAPTATDTQFTDLTEITAGNGYTAGGGSVTVSSSAQTSGVYKLIASNLVFTASGGTIGPFRYAVLYNDTATNKEVVGYHDYGSSITLLDGENLTWKADATAGVVTIT